MSNNPRMKEAELLCKEYSELFSKPPFAISELSVFFESLAFIFFKDPTYGIGKVTSSLNDMWDYIDRRYDLASRFIYNVKDARTKNHLQLDLFDNTIRRILIPTAAKIAWYSVYSSREYSKDDWDGTYDNIE